MFSRQIEVANFVVCWPNDSAGHFSAGGQQLERAINSAHVTLSVGRSQLRRRRQSPLSRTEPIDRDHVRAFISQRRRAFGRPEVGDSMPPRGRLIPAAASDCPRALELAISRRRRAPFALAAAAAVQRPPAAAKTLACALSALFTLGRRRRRNGQRDKRALATRDAAADAKLSLGGAFERPGIGMYQ